jgi:quinoprotein glucose dehydrogenase
VDFGTDGSLYVLDWVETWGGVGKGRIYKFSDPTADTKLQAETKKLISEGMSRRTPEELGKLLEHPDQRVRQAAQFELVARGAGSASVLVEAARHGANTLARVHGIWGLGQLATEDRKHTQIDAPFSDLAAFFLTDRDPEVRAQAAHVLGYNPAAHVEKKLIAMLADSAPRPRMFAALALRKLADPAAVEPLFAMLAENNDHDPVLRHAAVMGLTGCAQVADLVAKTGDPSVAVRAGAVVALRRLESAEIAKFLDDKDQTVVLEAARAIYDVPIAGAMPALAKLSGRKDLTDANLLLRVLNANYRLGQTENAVALAAYAANGAAPEPSRREALTLLTNWASPEARDRLINLHRPLPDRGPNDAASAVAASIPSLLKDSPAPIQEAAARLVTKLGIQSAGDSLFTLAMSPGASSGAKIAAIEALAAIKDPRLAQVARAALADKDGAIRAKGLQALTDADPAAAVKLIGEVLNTGNTRDKQGALLALQQLKGPEANALLSEWLDRLMAGSVPPEIQLDVLETARKANTVELNNKLKQYEAALPSSDPLSHYMVALSGGDASRGRKIFREKPETQCTRCHKCEIGDSQVGPDLTHVAAHKDRLYLLESIVYPNAKIAEGFETVVLTLKDKSIVVGRLAKSDPTTLQIETMDEKGKPKSVTVPVAQIEARVGAPSPMPENLRDFLSKSEIRDLVEYLAGRK